MSSPTVVVTQTDPPAVTVTASAAPSVTVSATEAPSVTVSATANPTVSVSSDVTFNQADARNSISVGGDLSYNSTTGLLSYSEPKTLSVLTNDAGFTTKSSFSATGTGLSYNNSTGVFAYSGPSSDTKNKEVIGITIDGGSNVITTGIKGWRRIPYACTVQQINLVCNASGNLEVTIRTRASGAISGTSATTDVISVSSAQTAQITSSFDDATIAADDMFEFEVTGTPATITRATVMVELAES